MNNGFSLQDHFDLTKRKLEEAKPLVKLFAFDYDGTIYDGLDYKQPEVIALVEKILAKGKSVSFITASAASALKTFVPLLKEFLVSNNINKPVFIGVSNGTVLFELKKGELKKIYSHGLNFEEINQIISGWKKIYDKFSNIDLAEKGLNTFQKFLGESWVGYISDEILNLCRPYEGKIFAEEAKVTFVLPRSKDFHEQIINDMKKELGEQYSIVAGNELFCHITKKLEEDSKAVAVKAILKLLNLKLTEVVTFGDMPTGNDEGLLNFPYSFTNLSELIRIKSNLQKPPYILFEPELSPVAKIYKAVEYLIL
ncbi:MAG: HAD hydrolase family protein [Patescibacteria group bacterium]